MGKHFLCASVMHLEPLSPFLRESKDIFSPAQAVSPFMIIFS